MADATPPTNNVDATTPTDEQIAIDGIATETTPSTTLEPTTVEFYSGAWALYLLCTVLFLVFVHLLMRRWKNWLRIPLWSALAAGALTPAASTATSQFQAPAIIVAILGFDVDGMAGFSRGFVPILTWFVGFILILSVVEIWQSKRAHLSAHAQTDAKDATPAITEASNTEQERPNG